MTYMFLDGKSTGYAGRSSANPRYPGPCWKRLSECERRSETQLRSRKLPQTTRDLFLEERSYAVPNRESSRVCHLDLARRFHLGQYCFYDPVAEACLSHTLRFQQ